MTERKFTPPTSFPAEYVDGTGAKVVLYGRGHGDYPLIGQHENEAPVSCTEGGDVGLCEEIHDLHDIPKRITTWHNVYNQGVFAGYDSRYDVDKAADQTRFCVYRIERDADGGNPQMFVEDV